MRATRAIVDLDVIAGNVTALRKLAPPQTRFLAVVKADAYGHGAPQVAAHGAGGRRIDPRSGDGQRGDDPAPLRYLCPNPPPELD